VNGVPVMQAGRKYHFGCCNQSCFPAPAEDLNGIPCDVCGRCVPFEDYASHTAAHGSNCPSASDRIPCEVCSEQVVWSSYASHVATHGGEQRPAEEEARLEHSYEPDDVAMQLVEMVRREGEALQRRYNAGDICNFDVAARFVRHMQIFGDEGGLPYASAEVVFHWTREENIASIVENNLRVAGEATADGMRISTAHGAAHGRGIYAATEISYGARYGHGAPCSLLCLALPGKALEGSSLSHGYDSLRNGDMRVYRSSSQLLPLFLTDLEHSGQVKEAAKRAAAFLLARAERVPERWTISHPEEW